MLVLKSSTVSGKVNDTSSSPASVETVAIVAILLNVPTVIVAPSNVDVSYNVIGEPICNDGIKFVWVSSAMSSSLPVFSFKS